MPDSTALEGFLSTTTYYLLITLCLRQIPNALPQIPICAGFAPHSDILLYRYSKTNS